MLALLWGLAMVPPAAAEAVPGWAHQPYAYVVVEQPVRGVLEAFGRNLGLPMDIAPEVQGMAQPNLRAASAGEFLDRLCSSNGLSWFYDGSVLHVGSLDALAMQRFAPQGVDVQALRGALDEQGVAGQQLSIKLSVHGAQAFLVAGPPAYLALVQRTIERLRPGPAPTAPAVQPREHGVRVFRGSAPVQRVGQATKGSNDTH